MRVSRRGIQFCAMSALLMAFALSAMGQQTVPQLVDELETTFEMLGIALDEAIPLATDGVKAPLDGALGLSLSALDQGGTLLSDLQDFCTQTVASIGDQKRLVEDTDAVLVLLDSLSLSGAYAPLSTDYQAAIDALQSARDKLAAFPPRARDDIVSSEEDTPLSFSVLANDLNADDFAISPSDVDVTLLSQPAHGTVTLDIHTDTMTFTPDADYFTPVAGAPETFSYQICDVRQTSVCDSAEVRITVLAVNDPPVARDDSAQMQKSTTGNIQTIIVNVAGNDTDVENALDLASVTIIGEDPALGTGSGSLGTVTSLINGVLTFQANLNAPGVQRLTYQICDTGGRRQSPDTDTGPLCASALLTILIAQVNTLPIARDDAVQVGFNQIREFRVVANDEDFEDNLDLTVGDATSGMSISSVPTHGTATMLADGWVRYAPTKGYVGQDEFFYQICDTGGPRTLDDVQNNVDPGPLCNTARVSINVAEGNNNPLAVDDAYSFNEGTATFTVSDPTQGILGNDTDSDTRPNGDKDQDYLFVLTAASKDLVDQPLPDDPGTNVPRGSVDPPPAPYIDTETERDGFVRVYRDGTFEYTPPYEDYFGRDRFYYQVSDGRAGGDEAVVVLNIANVNDAPHAFTDTDPMHLEGTALTVAAANGVLANDYDIDNPIGQVDGVDSSDALDTGCNVSGKTPHCWENGNLQAVLLGGVIEGTFTLNPDGGYTFMPPDVPGVATWEDWFGQVSFTYTASDGTILAVEGEISNTITFTDVNDAPVAADDTYTVNELNGSASEGSLTSLIDTEHDTPNGGASLLDNDYDIDDPQDASAAASGCGSASPQPSVNCSSVSDVQVVSTSVVSPKTLLEGSDARALETDANDVAQPGALASDISSSSKQSYTTAKGGSGFYDPDSGDFDYKPPYPDWFGTDTFYYTVQDEALSDVGQVTISVNNTNDAPITVNDSYTGGVDESATLNITASNGVLSNDRDVDHPLGADSDASGCGTFASPVTARAVANCTNAVSASNGLQVTSQTDLQTNFSTNTTVRGKVSIAVDGSFVYTAPTFGGVNGPCGGSGSSSWNCSSINDTFSYQVCDTAGACSSSTVTVLVNLSPRADLSFNFSGSGCSSTANNNHSQLLCREFNSQVPTSSVAAGDGVAGEFIIITVPVTNLGPFNASDVKYSFSLPSGWNLTASKSVVNTSGSLVTVSPGATADDNGQCTQVGTTVTCTVGNLSSGASATQNIAVLVPDNASNNTAVSITATLSYDAAVTADPVTSNNTTSASTTVRTRANMVIESITGKQSSTYSGTNEDDMVAGTDSSWKVFVRNLGPSLAFDANLINLGTQLPAGYTVSSCSNSGNSITLSNGSCPALNGALYVGNVIYFTLTIAVDSGYVADNRTNPVGVTFEVGSNVTDHNLPNTSTKSSVNVLSRADLRVSSVALSGGANRPPNGSNRDSRWAAGDTRTVTVTLVNDGPSDVGAGTLQTSADGGSLTFANVSVSRISPGDSWQKAFTNIKVDEADVSYNQSITITATAAASSPAVDPNSGNDSGTKTFTVDALVDLKIAYGLQEDGVVDEDCIDPTGVLCDKDLGILRAVSNDGPTTLGFAGFRMILLVRVENSDGSNDGGDILDGNTDAFSSTSGFDGCSVGTTTASFDPSNFPSNETMVICNGGSLSVNGTAAVYFTHDDNDINRVVKAAIYICDTGSTSTSCTPATSKYDPDTSNNGIGFPLVAAPGLNLDGDSQAQLTTSASDAPSDEQDGGAAPGGQGGPSGGDNQSKDDANDKPSLQQSAAGSLFLPPNLLAIIRNGSWPKWLLEVARRLQPDITVAGASNDRRFAKSDVDKQEIAISAPAEVASRGRTDRKGVATFALASYPVGPVRLADVDPAQPNTANDEEDTPQTLVPGGASGGGATAVLAYDAAPQPLVCGPGGALDDVIAGVDALNVAHGALVAQLNAQAAALAERVDLLVDGSTRASRILSDLKGLLAASASTQAALDGISSALNPVLPLVQRAQMNLDTLRNLIADPKLDTAGGAQAQALINQIIADLQAAGEPLAHASDLLRGALANPVAFLVRETKSPSGNLLVGWGPSTAFSSSDTIDGNQDFRRDRILRPDPAAMVDWMEPDNKTGTIHIRVGVQNTGLAPFAGGALSVQVTGLEGTGPNGEAVDAGTLSATLPELLPGQVYVTNLDTGIAYRTYSGTIRAELRFNNALQDTAEKAVDRCDSTYAQTNYPRIELNPAPLASTERSFPNVPLSEVGQEIHNWRVYDHNTPLTLTAIPVYGSVSQMVSQVNDGNNRYEVFCRQPITYQWDVTSYQPLETETIVADPVEGKSLTLPFARGLHRVQVSAKLSQEVTLAGDRAITAFIPLMVSQSEHIVVPGPSLRVEKITVGPPGGSLNGGWTQQQLLPSNFTLDQRVTMDVSAAVVNMDVLGLRDLPAAKALLQADSADVQLWADDAPVGTKAVSNIPLVSVTQDNSGHLVVAEPNTATTTFSWQGVEGEHNFRAQVDPSAKIDELSRSDNVSEQYCQSYWVLERAGSIGSQFIEYGPAEAVASSTDDRTVLAIKKQPAEGFTMTVRAGLRFVPKSVALDAVCPIALRNVWDFGDGSPTLNLATSKLASYAAFDSQVGSLGTTVGLSVAKRFAEGTFMPTMTSYLGEGLSKVVFRTRGEALDVTDKPVILRALPQAEGIMFIGLPFIPPHKNKVGVDILWNGNTPKSVTYTANWLPEGQRTVTVSDPSNPQVEYEMTDLGITSESIHNLLTITAIGTDQETSEVKPDVASAQQKPYTYEFVAGNMGIDLFLGGGQALAQAEPIEGAKGDAPTLALASAALPARLSDALWTSEALLDEASQWDLAQVRDQIGKVGPLNSSPLTVGMFFKSPTLDHMLANGWKLKGITTPEGGTAQVGQQPRQPANELELTPPTVHATNLPPAVAEDPRKLDHLGDVAAALGGQLQERLQSVFRGVDEVRLQDPNVVRSLLDKALKDAQLTVPNWDGANWLASDAWGTALDGVAPRSTNAPNGYLSDPDEAGLNWEQTLMAQAAQTSDNLGPFLLTVQVQMSNSGSTLSSVVSDGLILGSATKEGATDQDIACPGTCSLYYDVLEGTFIGLQQQQPQDVTLLAKPALGWRLKSVSTNCVQKVTDPNQCVVNMSQDKTVVFTFEPQPKLQVAVNPPGLSAPSGSVIGANSAIVCSVAGSKCATFVDAGTVVTLEAIADPGMVFQSWSGPCSLSNSVSPPTCNVTVNQDVSVTANFSAQQFTLTVNGTGTGGGTIASQDGALNCRYDGAASSGTCTTNAVTDGTTVALTATADTNSVFVGWAGDCSGTNVSFNLNVTANATCTAAFTHKSDKGKALAVTFSGTGEGYVQSADSNINIDCHSDPVSTGTNTCVHSYEVGTQVTLIAFGDNGSQFDGWSGCDSVDNNQCALTIGQNTSIGANFGRQFTLTVDLPSGGQIATVGESGASAITCTPTSAPSACQAAYPSTATVTLKATPESGSDFASWGGCVPVESDPTTCAVRMTGEHKLSALFRPRLLQLKVSVDEGPRAQDAGRLNGSGTLTSDIRDATTSQAINCRKQTDSATGTCAIAIPYGAKVTMKATPDGGSMITDANSKTDVGSFRFVAGPSEGENECSEEDRLNVGQKAIQEVTCTFTMQEDTEISVQFDSPATTDLGNFSEERCFEDPRCVKANQWLIDGYITKQESKLSDLDTEIRKQQDIIDRLPTNTLLTDEEKAKRAAAEKALNDLTDKYNAIVADLNDVLNSGLAEKRSNLAYVISRKQAVADLREKQLASAGEARQKAQENLKSVLDANRTNQDSLQMQKSDLEKQKAALASQLANTKDQNEKMRLQGEINNVDKQLSDIESNLRQIESSIASAKDVLDKAIANETSAREKLMAAQDAEIAKTLERVAFERNLADQQIRFAEQAKTQLQIQIDSNTRQQMQAQSEQQTQATNETAAKATKDGLDIALSTKLTDIGASERKIADLQNQLKTAPNDTAKRSLESQLTSEQQNLATLKTDLSMLQTQFTKAAEDETKARLAKQQAEDNLNALIRDKLDIDVQQAILDENIARANEQIAQMDKLDALTKLEKAIREGDSTSEQNARTQLDKAESDINKALNDLKVAQQAQASAAQGKLQQADAEKALADRRKTEAQTAADEANRILNNSNASEFQKEQARQELKERNSEQQTADSLNDEAEKRKDTIEKEQELAVAKVEQTTAEQQLSEAQKAKDAAELEAQKQEKAVQDAASQYSEALKNGDANAIDAKKTALESASQDAQAKQTNVQASQGTVDSKTNDVNNAEKKVDNQRPPSRGLGAGLSLQYTIERDESSKSLLHTGIVQLDVDPTISGKAPSRIQNSRDAKVGGGGDQKRKGGVDFSFAIGGQLNWNTAAKNGDIGTFVDFEFNIPVYPKFSVNIIFSFSFSWLYTNGFNEDGTQFGFTALADVNFEVPISPSPIPAPIPMSADVSITFGYDMSIKYDQGHPFDPAFVKKVDGSFFLEGEVWAAIDLKIAKGGPFGGGGVTFELLPKQKYVCARGFVGIRLVLDLIVFSGTFEGRVTWKDGACSPESTLVIDQPGSIKLNDSRSYAGSNYAKFEQQTAAPNTFGVEETQLISNAFPEGSPQLIAAGDRYVLVWVQDDVSKPLLQARELWYATAGPDLVFSAPQRLTDDLVPDGAPSLALDAQGRVLMAWSRNRNPQLLSRIDPNTIDRQLKDVFAQRQLTVEANEPAQSRSVPALQTSEPGIADGLSQQEVAYAVFDPSSGQWTEPQFLTDNNVLDEDIHLVSDGRGHVMLTWVENESNLPYPVTSPPNPATVMAAGWDAPSQTWVDMQTVRAYDVATERAFAYREGQLLYAFVEADQLNAGFFENGQLDVLSRLSAGQSSAPAAIFTPDGQPRVLWISKGETQSSASIGAQDAELMEAQFSANAWQLSPHLLEGTSVNSFKLAEDGEGNLSLFWAQRSDTQSQGVDIYMLTYDGAVGQWTDKKQLTDDVYEESSLSPVVVGQTISAAYLKTEVNFEDQEGTYRGADALDPSITYSGEKYVIPNVPVFGPSHLYVLRAGLDADLTFEQGTAGLLPVHPAPGDAISIEIGVKNVGRFRVDKPIEVALQSVESGSEVARVTLDPLEVDASATARFRWTVPAQAARQTLLAVIDPDDHIAEARKENNSLAIAVISHDWAITDARATLDSVGLDPAELASMLSASGEAALNMRHQMMHISATVTNHGPLEAPAAVLQIDYGPDSGAKTVRDRHTAVGSVSVPPLAVGESANLVFDWDITELTDGDIHLYFSVGPAGADAAEVAEVAEVDLSNNVFTTLVREQPDLKIVGTQDGDTLNIRVLNVGSANASNVVVRVYATGADGALGELIAGLQVPLVEDLSLVQAFGGEVFTTLKLPQTTSDGQPLQALALIVDPDNVIGEIDDSNNTYRLAIEPAEGQN